MTLSCQVLSEIFGKVEMLVMRRNFTLQMARVCKKIEHMLSYSRFNPICFSSFYFIFKHGRVLLDTEMTFKSFNLGTLYLYIKNIEINLNVQARRTRCIIAVSAISSYTRSKVQNYMELYGKKKVQNHFLMLKNGILTVNCLQSVF